LLASFSCQPLGNNQIYRGAKCWNDGTPNGCAIESKFSAALVGVQGRELTIVASLCKLDWRDSARSKSRISTHHENIRVLTQKRPQGFGRKSNPCLILTLTWFYAFKVDLQTGSSAVEHHIALKR